MNTRSSTARVAARPRAVRLDELPAEVIAEALCWTALQDHLCYARTGLKAFLDCRWPAWAGPAGVRGPSHRAVCPLARGLDTGLNAADSLQARFALDIWMALGRGSGELSWEHSQSDRRFKEALEAPFWTTLPSDITSRLWRALRRPGAVLRRLLVSECVCCAVKHSPSALYRSPCLVSTRLDVSLVPEAGLPGASSTPTPHGRCRYACRRARLAVAPGAERCRQVHLRSGGRHGRGALPYLADKPARA